LPSDESTSPLGLVGVGSMGIAIARHIIHSGRTVIGWDRRPEALLPLVEAGGVAANGLSDLRSASVVISIVFDDAGAHEVTLGPPGLVGVLGPGALHVVMSSISPALSRSLSESHAAKGQRYLAASIFGRPEAAAAAELWINCSGRLSVYEEVKPILDLLGRPSWVGPEPEQAMLVKTMGNSMITVSAQLMREMFTFLRAGGIEEAKAKELIIDTLFASPIFSGYSQRYIADPGATRMTPIARKDRNICIEAAHALGIELPTIAFLAERDLP
jgi:3-hydroxyisobutyrate dehydrogenase-like beta-hydroxyacid dehydrogenase